MRRRRSGPHDDVAPRGQRRLMRTREHAETPLDGVARHGMPHVFRHRESQALGTGIRNPAIDDVGNSGFTYAKMHNKVTTGDLGALLYNMDEIAVTFQSLHKSAGPLLRRQNLAALGAATVDGRAAGTGAHAHAETVLHVTTAIVGLECPLHS